jgi:heat shock protein HslJ
MAESMQRLAVLAASVLAAGLCACASAPPAPPAPPALDGTAWMLSRLNAQTLDPDAPRPTLRFDGDRVVGSDGCNRFVGYRFGDGAALKLGRDLAATRRTCADATQAAADAYGRTLARVAAWRLEGGSLVLLDRRDTALASFAPQPAALTDTVWRVTGFADGHRGWSGLRRSSLVTVEFDPEGRVRGFGGCAPYGGVWAVVDRRLDVGPLQSAHADCEAFVDLRAQQRSYLRSLGRAAALRRDGDRLELLDGAGEVVATAEAMPRGGPIARR